VRRRFSSAAAVAAAAGLVVAPLAAATATAGASPAPSWVATATEALPLTAGVTELGPLARTSALTVEVALKLRNTAELHRDIAAGRVFSAAAFRARFSPTRAQVASVESYLHRAGLRPGAVTGNRLLISASGTTSAVESAFATTLAAVRVDGRTGYANVTAAHVPVALGATVASVLGLNDVYTMKTTSLQVRHEARPAGRPATTGAANPPSSCAIADVPYDCYYNPQGFQIAYDATKATTGAKTVEAIFAEGLLTQVVKDLRLEETANGLPKVPVTIVKTGVASTDTSGADEFDLDTQYSTGMAQTVKSLQLYDSPTLDDSDTAIEFADFASQDKAKAGSASFGECEADAFLDGSMLADDETFSEAAAQGQTVFASAGDTGGFCSAGTPNGVPAGVPDVNYPASSPYVVGVGGTSLLTNTDGSYEEELAWVAGGGGISYFESQPSWQAGDGVLGTIGSETNQRTLPDVSMDADPNTGANVYVDGTPEAVGGTSLASPLALGVWDRVEAHNGEKVPFASPVLYVLNGSAAYHDITLGDTGPYPATPGYDLATGIGTFDVAKAETLIK
jgi:subtilase family serine protease